MRSPSLAFLAAVSTPPGGIDPQRIAGAARGVTDWGSTRSLALQHGLLPQMHRHLSLYEDLVTSSFADDLRERQRTLTRKNLGRVSNLMGLLDGLEAAGIAAVPFKGPMLAARLYDDVGQRVFTDLDLLVRRRDAEAALRVLEGMGYRMPLQIPRTQHAQFERINAEYTLVSDEGAIVEIQWALAPRYFALGVDSDRLMQRSGTDSFAGRRVRALNDEDLVLGLALHGGKHLWSRLAWISDLGVLLAGARVDWPSLFEQARSLGVERHLAVAVSLPSLCFGVEVPEGVEAELRRDPRVRSLVDRLERRLDDPSLEEADVDERSEALDPLHLLLRERTADRARYVFRLLATPSPADWRFVALPARLQAGYVAVRPVRWLTELMRGAIRGSPTGLRH